MDKPLLSVNDLAWRLRVSVVRLREMADNVETNYSQWGLPSKANKDVIRIIRSPSPELKTVQRRIKSKVLAVHPLDDSVHGGVRGRSPRSNAEQHLGQRCVAKLDVRSFYPNVRHYMVYRTLRELGYGRNVARLLTRLTTLKGSLPQGAPTSTMMANLVLARTVDRALSDAARSHSLRVTRFVDDITISGSNPRPLINLSARLLSSKRLPIWRNRGRGAHRNKLKITPRTKPQEVTGLIVNSTSGPSISRPTRDRIRAAVWALRNASNAAALKKEVNSIRGRIAYVRQFNPGAAERLQARLQLTMKELSFSD